MAKLGIHVRPGSRNGYGPFTAAKPAVVIAVDEGGALLEAKEESGDYAVTIFRDTSVYLEAPPDFDSNPNMVMLAQFWYPQIRAKWQQNPAKYYTITNEIGGNDPVVMRRLVDYEREVMRLANLDGFKVAVLNLATGTPESLDQWKEIYAPFIVEAWQGKNLYARHVYGTGDLVDGSGNVVVGDPQRPFTELGYLRSLGVTGGIALTECGLDAGFNFAGIGRFTTQMAGYEKLLRPYPEFVGLCGWTLGLWKPTEEDANCQDAMPSLTQYLIANPTAKWEWPTTQPPPIDPPDPEPSGRVVTVTAANVRLSPSTSGNTPIGTVPAGTEFELVDDIPSWYGVKVWISKQVANPVDDETPPPSPVFRATAWPSPTLRTTQWFAANPQNYQQFGLPGHDGTDHRALTGQPIKAVAPGRVYMAGSNQQSPNYGIQVRIDHDNGHRTIYAHLQQVSVSVNQVVVAGQVIGLADATGNSTGSHLHLAYKRDGVTYTDPAGNVWPNNIHDPWTVLEPLYNEYLAAVGITGYLWANSTVKHPHFNWGFGSTNLNLRQDGNGNSPILGLVQAGVPFKITGPKTSAGYYPAVALLGDLPPGTQPPPVGNEIDLVPYFVTTQPFGTLYEVKTENAGQQRHQTQVEGNVFFHTKDSEWEQLAFDNNFIFRGIDTSPGNGRYYRLNDDDDLYWSRWAARRMAVGQVFERKPTIAFYRKSDCAVLSVDEETNYLKLTAVHNTYTFFTGIVLNNVIALEWTGTPGGPFIERYFYSVGYGLCGWESADGRRAAISEIHAPGARPPNQRESGCFS